MKEHIAVLRELGLTEKEAECYLALLKLGFATSGELMKLLRYYSKTVYQILDKLLGKGLVSYVIKANIKYFQAVDPHEFLDILNEQEDQLKIKVKKIEQIIPQLISLRALTKEHQEANMYVGSKGMKSVFDDALKETSEILVFGGGGKTEEFLGDYIKFWHKKRAEKKIKLRILWNENLRERKDKILEYNLLDIKFLPKEFDNPAPAMIYDNKVAITVWAESPLAILIRSKEVSRTYLAYFELLWKIAIK